MTNPCQADPTLCLDICDNLEQKSTLKCQVQKCEIMPHLPKCKEIENCKIKRECTYENMFELP